MSQDGQLSREEAAKHRSRAALSQLSTQRNHHETHTSRIRGFRIRHRTHHEAAIDMAKVVLANGKDVDTKTLAQEIIAAQEKEIATIDAWLRKKEHSGSELSSNFGDGRLGQAAALA